MEIKDIIKSLVQQCNIDSISTKDLIKELTDLYQKVETLESETEKASKDKSYWFNEYQQAEQALKDFKVQYVTPAEELAKQKAQLEQDKFKFDVEKGFAVREVEIYKEIVRSLTVSYSFNENYSGGSNGSYYNRYSQGDKPNLPGGTFTPK